jgi:hypothetical protein
MRIDLGCGKKKREGFIGVDIRQFDGVDVVCDLGKDAWPWSDSTVEEVHCSHLVEHLKPEERIHFVNELWRVMKPGAKAMIFAPHWASCRAYGDLTHQWPPISEQWPYYLNRAWREEQAPHNDGYKCDFEQTVGHAPSPVLTGRSPDYVAFALSFYKESALDILITLTKKTG